MSLTAVVLKRNAKDNVECIQLPHACHLTILQGRQLRAQEVIGRLSAFYFLLEQGNSISYEEMSAFNYFWPVVRVHIIYLIWPEICTRTHDQSSTMSLTYVLLPMVLNGVECGQKPCHMWNSKGHWIDKTHLKKNKAGRLVLSNFRISHKAGIIKTVWCWLDNGE